MFLFVQFLSLIILLPNTSHYDRMLTLVYLLKWVTDPDGGDATYTQSCKFV